MKRKVTGIILLVTAMAVALSCGPGNGKAPYKGSTFVGLDQMVDQSITMRSSNVWFSSGTTVYNRDCNKDGKYDTADTGCVSFAAPVPNILVNVHFQLSSTITDYMGWAMIVGDDDEYAIGNSGDVSVQSDFNGNIMFRLFVPIGFDGEVQIKVSVTNDEVTQSIAVKFNSGTTCTDGEDNNKNGMIDAADPACPNGFSVEPTVTPPTPAVLNAVQSPLGNVAVNGIVHIAPSGGTAPYTFLSTAPGVATVDSAGAVTGVATGNTGIVVTDSVGTTFTVSVFVGAPASFEIAPLTATYAVGGNTILTATVYDSSHVVLVGLNMAIADWSSDAPGVAKIISTDGTTATLDGSIAGTAHITVIYGGGGLLTNQSTITVT